MYKDSAVTTNQFDQVTAQLKSEQASLEAMQNDLLTSKSVTTQNELNIASAKATVKRKTADLAAAQLQLSYTKIIATANGILGERTIQAGEFVNTNQVLVEIVLQDKNGFRRILKKHNWQKLNWGSLLQLR